MSDFKAKIYQIQFPRSPDPLGGLRGPTSKGRGGDGKGRGSPGEGRGRDPTPLRPPNPYFWIPPWCDSNIETGQYGLTSHSTQLDHFNNGSCDHSTEPRVLCCVLNTLTNANIGQAVNG